MSAAIPHHVRFSVAAYAGWAPGVTSPDAWQAWADQPFRLQGDQEPAVQAMPPMLRRRAGALGKMALEAAWLCAGEQRDLPTLFCSRHGDAVRSLALLESVVAAEPVSPTAFGLSVHNAVAGLFSIARTDQSNHLALAGGASTVAQAVIEACGLLADGAPQVLLVNYDTALPALFQHQQDCAEQPYAWAWLMTPVSDAAPTIELTWSAAQGMPAATTTPDQMPHGLAVWQFFLAGAVSMAQQADRCLWHWSRHA